MKKRRKKRIRKSSPSATVVAQRLHAIDKLLNRQHYEQALVKIGAALQTYPRHGGLYQRRIEALTSLQRNWEAEMAAYQWTRACPNSIQAWHTLYIFSTEHQRLMLAMDAARHHNALVESSDQPQVPMLSDAQIELLTTSPFTGERVGTEELLLMELGQLCVENHHYEEGIEFLRGSSQPPARNNLAICLFHLGRIDEALQCMEENWDQVPENILALSWLARLRLFVGDEDHALGLAAPLAHAMPSRDLDAVAQITGLLILGKEQEALEAFRAAQRQAWWAESELSKTFAVLLHLGAVCHARSGDTAQAAALWEQALDLNLSLAYVQANLEDLKRPSIKRHGAYPLPLYEWLPGRWLKHINTGQTNWETLDDFAQIHTNYLRAIARIGDPPTLEFCQILLRLRCKKGDEAAKEGLLALLEGRQGSTSERMSIGASLVEDGLIDPQDSIDIWDGEDLRTVQLKKHKIIGESRPTSLSARQQKRMKDALTAIENRELHKAKKILEQLTVEAPAEPTVWTNLAVVYEYLGDKKQRDALIERAVEIEPDYLMGRCNLAMVKLQHNDLETARQLLEGLLDRTEFYAQEIITLYGVHAALRAKAGDFEQAENMLDSVMYVAEEFDEMDRLNSYRAMIQQSLFAQGIGSLKKMTSS